MNQTFLSTEKWIDIENRIQTVSILLKIDYVNNSLELLNNENKSNVFKFDEMTLNQSVKNKAMLKAMLKAIEFAEYELVTKKEIKA